MQRRFYYCLLCLFGLLVASFTLEVNVAYSQGETKWVMDGAGCVPVEDTIQQDRYLITAGRIKFKNGKSGTITSICPVSKGVGRVNAIFASYLDASGRDAEGLVQVSLRRIRKRDGVVATVPGFVFTSDDHPETTYNFAGQLTDRANGHVLDDVNYYYFVQLTMRRRSTDVITEFGGVELSLVRPIACESTLGPTGREWKLDVLGSVINPKPALPTPEISAVFTPSSPGSSSGEISGSAGCNVYNAKYTITGRLIDISDVQMTLRLCSPPVMEQERQFTRILQNAGSFCVIPHPSFPFFKRELRIQSRDAEDILLFD